MSLTELKKFFCLAIAAYNKIRIQLIFNSLTALPDSANAAGYDQNLNPTPEFIQLLSQTPRRTHEVNVFSVKPNNTNPVYDGGIATYAGGGLTFHRKEIFGGIIIQELRNKAATFAHELRHYLGLYHTNTDLISDTGSTNHTLFGSEKHYLPNLMTDGHSDSFVITPE